MKTKLFFSTCLMVLLVFNGYCQTKPEKSAEKNMDIIKKIQPKNIPNNKGNSGLNERALNPQPLPPKESMSADKKELKPSTPLSGSGTSTQNEKALNPQPLPPKEGIPVKKTIQRR